MAPVHFWSSSVPLRVAPVLVTEVAVPVVTVTPSQAAEATDGVLATASVTRRLRSRAR
jgi:hypothetical protein